jgi:hypothetical protein
LFFENTKSNIGKYNINSVADVINCGVNIVSYSDLMSKNQSELKKFLHKNLYKHNSSSKIYI